MPDRNNSQSNGMNSGSGGGMNNGLNNNQNNRMNENPDNRMNNGAQRGRNNNPGSGQDEMIFLPESPETPEFGPPPGENIPAVPFPNPSIPLPTPALPGGEPGTDQMPGRPQFPGTPGGGNRPPIAVYPIPIIPRPPQNNQQGYCTIRFIHAAVQHEAVNVAIGNKTLVNNLQYGEVSSYFIETDGFKTINVTNTRMRQMIIARETFLFNDGDVYTIAFVNGMNGLSMFLISDMPCRNQRQNFSCVRAVNLSYNAPALEVVVQPASVTFEDLRFKTVAPYKQAAQGEQEFFVSEMISGAPVLDVVETVGAGRMYTLYILGDAYGYPELSVVFTEDYSGLSEYL